MTKAKKSSISSNKLPDGKTRTAIICSLLHNPKNCRWGLEMKMLNRLLAEYNEPDFWFFFAKTHKFETLIHLITQKQIIFASHLEYIKQKRLSLPTSPSVELAQEKIGEDVIIPEKQKTLADFIK